MQGIFNIEVNDQTYNIRPLNLPPNDIHFGVCKNGVLQFVVERKINFDGDIWQLAYPDLNLQAPRELVDSIVEKIHAHFT